MVAKRRKGKKSKKLASLLIIACVLVGVALLLPFFSGGGIFSIFGDGDPSSEGDKSGLSIFGKDEIQVEVPDPITLHIVCTGDIMAHATQLTAQLMPDGSYDFSNNFKYIKKYIEGADLAICNVETTFGEAPYTGYPSFSTPDNLAQVIKETGYDVASTANNHMLDRGRSGLYRTLEILRASGLKTTGSIAEQSEPRYAMYQTNGINIAVIGYTYQTPTNSRAVAINGSVISDDLASYINSFGYEYIDEELVKINGTVEQARQAGADIVILYYHWGEEYQLSANKWQRYVAEKTIEMMDIDVIFGSHPHVLQEAEILQKHIAQNGESGSNDQNAEMIVKDIPVFFSLGNLISNQRQETLSNKYTEQGVIAMVDITIKPDTREIINVTRDALPTWVDRFSQGGKTYYYIIPLDDELDQNETLAISGHLARAKDALEEANGLLGINR